MNSNVKENLQVALTILVIAAAWAAVNAVWVAYNLPVMYWD